MSPQRIFSRAGQAAYEDCVQRNGGYVLTEPRAGRFMLHDADLDTSRSGRATGRARSPAKGDGSSSRSRSSIGLSHRQEPGPTIAVLASPGPSCLALRLDVEVFRRFCHSSTLGL